jgi:hypothetical protein
LNCTKIGRAPSGLLNVTVKGVPVVDGKGIKPGSAALLTSTKGVRSVMRTCVTFSARRFKNTWVCAVDDTATQAPSTGAALQSSKSPTRRAKRNGLSSSLSTRVWSRSMLTPETRTEANPATDAVIS